MPSNPASEVERRYAGFVLRRNGLTLLPGEQVLQLLNDLSSSPLRFAFLEAFKLVGENQVQPSLEYSHPSPDGIQAHGFMDAMKATVAKGIVQGFSWFEVWVEDSATGESFAFGDRRAA